MNRRHITPATRLHYDPQKKSHKKSKDTSEHPRWRRLSAQATPRCRTQSKHYTIDLIERKESTAFTLYTPTRQSDDHPPYDDVVPPLSQLCLRYVTVSEKSFRSKLPRLLRDDYLPNEMRNGINSTALAKGYLVNEREMRRLLLHAEMEELDFSHPSCRELVNDAFLRYFFPHAPIIKEVDSWEEITPADLYRSPQGCPRLLRLSLAACWNISAQLLKDVLTSFAHLSVLDLSYLPVELVNRVRFESPTLTQLILSRIRGTRPSFPLTLTLVTPSLQLLSLRETHYVGAIATEASVPGLLLKRSSSSSLSSLPSSSDARCRLHALDISGVHLSVMPQDGSSALCSLLNLCFHSAATLKVINLAHCDVRPAMLAQIRALAVALPDLRLEEVSLANNKNLSSEAVVEFVRAFSGSLRLLDISRCDVHVAHISAIAQSLQPTNNFIHLRT